MYYNEQMHKREERFILPQNITIISYLAKNYS